MARRRLATSSRLAADPLTVIAGAELRVTSGREVTRGFTVVLGSVRWRRDSQCPMEAATMTPTADSPSSHHAYRPFIVHSLALICCMPPMYGLSASGTVTLPSAFWYSSSSEMRIRGLAMTVLFSV